MQDLQTKTTFVARNGIFKESKKTSMESNSEVGLNDFPDVEELNLRRNPIGTEVRKQTTDGQKVPPDQSASHERVF